MPAAERSRQFTPLGSFRHITVVGQPHLAHYLPAHVTGDYDAHVSETNDNRNPVVRLSAEDASKICMEQCRAMCCRGPIILRLAPGEVQGFEANANRLGVEAHISPTPEGGGWLKFTDHPGERCPMLDPTDFSCRAYAGRPQRCREFPERPEPGCAISGWTGDAQA